MHPNLLGSTQRIGTGLTFVIFPIVFVFAFSVHPDLAVLGSLALAADKGALCLTMSALDDLSDAEFASMMPGLLAIFSKRGWMALVWGILLLPVGFGIQAIALFKSKSIARWQSLLFLVGVLMIGTPDGVEIVNLTASILLAIAFVPYGIQIMRSENQEVVANGARGA